MTHQTKQSLDARRVNVSIPAEFANDIKHFSKIQKDILGRLGCMACCSGWDIRWNVERDFIIDMKGNIGQPRDF